MLMKEEKEAALNVKIEKLLFLFSWQNIFIAFSSATIFPLKWNIVFFTNVLLLFQPLIKTFSLPSLALIPTKLCGSEMYLKTKFDSELRWNFCCERNEGMVMMEVKCFEKYFRQKNDVKSRIVNSKISFSRIYRLIFWLGSRTTQKQQILNKKLPKSASGNWWCRVNTYLALGLKLWRSTCCSV